MAPLLSKAMLSAQSVQAPRFSLNKPSLCFQGARYFSKIVEVQLPDLGEGTKEATVKEWYVQPGS